LNHKKIGALSPSNSTPFGWIDWISSPLSHKSEPVDHKFSNIHLGAEAEVGERTPQNLGKNLFEPDPEQG